MLILGVMDLCIMTPLVNISQALGFLYFTIPIPFPKKYIFLTFKKYSPTQKKNKINKQNLMFSAY